jgi:hypothetical protein
VTEHVGRRILYGSHDRVRGLREAVVHPQAFPARSDQARPPQVGKMARGLGLRNLQGVVNVTHAHVPGHQEAQDAQPRRVGQSLEHLFELAELIRLRFASGRQVLHIFVLTNIASRR